MIERTGSGLINSLRQWSEEHQKKGTQKKGTSDTEQTAKQEIQTPLSTSSLLKEENQKKTSPLEDFKKEKLEDSKEKFKSKDVTLVKAQSAEDLKIAAEIRRLKMWEDHVIQHERMHMLAGGEFAGAPSYTYTTGPDGKRYIQGGEVTMYVPAGTTLEDSEVALEKVKRAAAAPSDPSPQDLKTSAMASARQASVRKMIARKQSKESYEKAKHQEVKLKEIKGEPIQALEKMKFQEVGGFDLFI